MITITTPRSRSIEFKREEPGATGLGVGGGGAGGGTNAGGSAFGETLSAMATPVNNCRFSLQELQRRGIELSRLLNVWDMTALVDHQQSRVGNLLLEPFTITQRSQPVVTPPNNQGGLFDVLDLVVEKI